MGVPDKEPVHGHVEERAKVGVGDEITPAPDRDAAPADPLRDKATQFLANHSAEDTPFTYEEEKAVIRRIDGRVLVLILGAYFFQQLDKSSLRYVALFQKRKKKEEKKKGFGRTDGGIPAMSPSLA